MDEQTTTEPQPEIDPKQELRAALDELYSYVEDCGVSVIKQTTALIRALTTFRRGH